jgi:hypothetical protein
MTEQEGKLIGQKINSKELKRVGLEIEDERLSRDWVEAVKETPLREPILEYPEIRY